MATYELNEAQLRVLEWVGRGCPPDEMEGYSHRVSAAALKSCGLVRIAGRGPRWKAELTDTGREWLASPRRPKPRPVTQRRLPAAGATTSATDGRAAGLSKTEELVAAVLAADGRLVLPDTTATGGVDWRQRAYAAQRHGKVPEGKRLVVSRTAEAFVIALADGSTDNELGAAPVSVPARIGRYHRVAAQFRDRTTLHEISRKTLPRALRIIHALVVEFERRGHAIECVVPARGDYGRSRWKPKDDGQLVVRIGGHERHLRLFEKGVGLRGPWEEHKARRQEARDNFRFDRWDYGRIEPYDKGATGEPTLTILGYGSRQRSWGDRKRWSLEDRLAQAVRELEVLAEEAEQARLRREREAEEHRRRWEQAMEAAKARFAEAHRREVLRARIERWNEAEKIRAYCDAIETRFSAEGIAAREGSADWLDVNAGRKVGHRRRSKTRPLEGWVGGVSRSEP